MTEENYNYRTSQTLLRNQFPGKGKLQIPIIPRSLENGQNIKWCNTLDDLLEYYVGPDRLRDVITKVTVIDRTL